MLEWDVWKMILEPDTNTERLRMAESVEENGCSFLPLPSAPSLPSQLLINLLCWDKTTDCSEAVHQLTQEDNISGAAVNPAGKEAIGPYRAALKRRDAGSVQPVTDVPTTRRISGKWAFRAKRGSYWWIALNFPPFPPLLPSLLLTAGFSRRAHWSPAFGVFFHPGSSQSEVVTALKAE